MPIYGLTETVRIPRLGKVHLGIKKISKGGADIYATDYFVCDDPDSQPSMVPSQRRSTSDSH